MTNLKLREIVEKRGLINKVKEHRFTFEKTEYEYYAKCYCVTFDDISCSRRDNVYTFCCGEAKAVFIENDIFGKDD